jgi:hypothetical protein
VKFDSFVGLLVAREGLAELHGAVEAGEQDLPQRDAARHPVLRDGVHPTEELEGQQLFHLLGEKAEAAMIDAAGRREKLEQVGGQTVVQRRAPLGANANAITLQSVSGRCIAFKECDAHARLRQSLGEGEAANAPTIPT